MTKMMKKLALATVLGAGLLVAVAPAAQVEAHSKYGMAQSQAAISYDRAIQIFQANYPEYQIKDVDFDVDYGRAHYEIEGYRGYEEIDVKIDANTGEIYRVKYDRD